MGSALHARFQEDAQPRQTAAVAITAAQTSTAHPTADFFIFFNNLKF
jgi:hypothetical protein